MSDSVRPHKRQPTRLPRPWDSQGKNTGVGCHFLLQCMKVKSESEIAQSCPTPSYTMDCSLPGSSVHGIFQARVLGWGAIAFSSFTPALVKYQRFTFDSLFTPIKENVKVKVTQSCLSLCDPTNNFRKKELQILSPLPGIKKLKNHPYFLRSSERK